MLCKFKNAFASQTMRKLYLNNDLADFTFTFGDEKVPVHKIILATASPVFFAMFFGQIKDKVSVKITDSYADAFKEFLQFVYLDEVELSMRNIEEVVKLADKYDMLDCINTCADFLVDRLTVENTLWGYKLAISLKSDELKQKCEKHLSLCEADLFKSDAFLHCDQSILKNVLQMDSLVFDEKDVLNACLSWAKHSCQLEGIDENNAMNLRAQLGDCLYLIRFSAMKMEEFTAQMASNKGLLTNDEIVEVVYTKIIPNFSPSLFDGKPRPSINPRKLDKSKFSTCKPGSMTGGYKSAQKKTSLVFSVNNLALLGMLNCILKIHDSYYGDYASNNNFEVEILEICENSSNSPANEKVLAKRTGAQEISFDPTILIYPYKLYEVRSEMKTTTSCYSHCAPWNSEYKLNDGLVVTIHHVASSSSSIVAGLNFQRI